VPIAASEYAVRLGTFLHCSESTFVVAAVLSHRLFEFNPALFCDRSVHKIMAACAIISAKFVDDRFFSNNYYAECAGVPLQEMNLLELSLLKMLNFRVFVGEEEFKTMKKHLDTVTQVKPFSLFQNFPTSSQAKTVEMYDKPIKPTLWAQSNPQMNRVVV
jgi:hypothetical protein